MTARRKTIVKVIPASNPLWMTSATLAAICEQIRKGAQQFYDEYPEAAPPWSYVTIVPEFELEVLSVEERRIKNPGGRRHPTARGEAAPT